jgi:hypothetical protein
MPRDVIDMVEPYLSNDPSQWAKLASDVQWRRMQLLLLREILLELRKRTTPPDDVSHEGELDPKA